MKITIDSREIRSGIIDIIQRNPTLEYEVKTMACGDYVVDEKIIFERKTLPDFLISIKEGRFFRQSYKMINRHVPYILILEGTRENIKNTGMKRDAIQGALIHISVFLGIPVLRSANLEETINLMLLAGEQVKKYNDTNQLRVNCPRIKAKKYKSGKLKLQVLQNLPGIGSGKAAILLKEFRNLNSFFTTDIDSLLKVKGLGKKTANRILNLIYS